MLKIAARRASQKSKGRIMKSLMIFAVAVFPMASFAHDYTVGDLVIAHPIAFETPVTAQTGAGYLSITNNGKIADRLVRVEAGFSRIMLHETKVDNDIATMRHQDTIDIPAGETVLLAPGGKHVMFMGLEGDPFEVGEEFDATLVFEIAGQVDITFKVEARPMEAVAADHNDH